jgi:hypothetical protein
MGYVRSPFVPFKGLLEALGFGAARLLEDDALERCEVAFDACRGRFGGFEVVLRLPYYGVVDKLQQGPPRYVPGAISCVKWEGGGREYLSAGSLDVSMNGISSSELLELLESALKKLTENTAERRAPGQDP